MSFTVNFISLRIFFVAARQPDNTNAGSSFTVATAFIVALYLYLSESECLELDNLMEVALLTARSAMNRTESRGAHSRYDFPERDDKNWHKHSITFDDGRYANRSVNMKPTKVKSIPLETVRGD